MDSTDLASVGRTLWAAADQLRANSTLAPSEYRGPVLGLIFLAYAEHRFETAHPEIAASARARAQWPPTTTGLSRRCSSQTKPGSLNW
ncbi:MAG: type I restriction-modification system subunit M N-terminal domain-containing protein [Acidimicrobiales bacterium]